MSTVSSASTKAARKEISDPEAYIPPSETLNSVITRTKSTAGQPIVSMPEAAFAKLLAAALSAGFDEKAYLDQYQDVKQGVENQTIPSGLKHFTAHGFFEGRRGLRIAVDSDWYLSIYPDVAQAIANEQVIDAQDHFMLFGYAEGRIPNKAFQQSIADWNALAQIAQQQVIKFDFMSKSRD